jgi:hypothetical protein
MHEIEEGHTCPVLLIKKESGKAWENMTQPVMSGDIRLGVQNSLLYNHIGQQYIVPKAKQAAIYRYFYFHPSETTKQSYVLYCYNKQRIGTTGDGT